MHNYGMYSRTKFILETAVSQKNLNLRSIYEHSLALSTTNHSLRSLRFVYTPDYGVISMTSEQTSTDEGCEMRLIALEKPSKYAL